MSLPETDVEDLPIISFNKPRRISKSCHDAVYYAVYETDHMQVNYIALHD